MAESSQRRHAITPETVPGTTPATPVWETLRLTGGGMTEQSGYVSSDEIRADRNIPDVTLVSRDVSGEFPIEMSYGSFDSLLAYFMCSAWAANVIKNGVLTQTFSYELTDEIGNPDDYERYTNCMVNTFALNIAAREKITGSFGIMGTVLTIGTAIVTGATYTAAGTNPVMAGSADVGALTINGTAGPKIQAMTLQGSNNLDMRPVVGSLASDGLRKGQFTLSGTINAYFNNTTLRDLQRAGGYTDITIVLGTGANKKYSVFMPKCRITNAPKSTPGNNQDIMLSLEFQAVYDATTLASLQITRTP